MRGRCQYKYMCDEAAIPWQTFPVINLLTFPEYISLTEVILLTAGDFTITPTLAEEVTICSSVRIKPGETASPRAKISRMSLRAGLSGRYLPSFHLIRGLRDGWITLA